MHSTVLLFTFLYPSYLKSRGNQIFPLRFRRSFAPNIPTKAHRYTSQAPFIPPTSPPFS